MADQTNDLIAQMIQAHVADHLRAYQGNLAFAIHIVQNEWLPAEDEPGIQQHLSALRQHMAENGHPEDDSFLLRLGLTAPGVQRGIVPPLMVLDANRGGFSARRQGEAAGQILRLREALAIGRRFVLNLSPNTQHAVAELAELSGRPPAHNEVVCLNWFNEVSSAGAEQLAEQAIQCLDSAEKSVNDIGTQILQHLACFRQSALSEACCHALLERGTYWPSSMYRDSGDAVARRLISRMGDTSGQLALNHLLLALAWTRSAAAYQAFRQWSNHPPAWARKLHVPPERYLHSAGWCLGDGGQRRDLISATCFRLVPAENEALRSFRCRTHNNEQCLSCGGRLGLLFDFSRLGGEYFPGEFADAPRKVLCCFHCACYGPVFTKYRPDGTAHWLSPIEPRESASFIELRSSVRKLDDSPCPPFACAEAFEMDDASTLGGVPMWLQDAEYPRCLECGRLMTFLAQHDNGPLGEEGIYYAFFCAPCHVAAVSYQQT
jgi:hypothetical protein